MKILTNPVNGRKTIQINKEEWSQIGKESGWDKSPIIPKQKYDNVFVIDYVQFTKKSNAFMVFSN